MELNHPQFGKWSKVGISRDCSRFVTLHFMGYGDCASENTVSSRQTDASLHQLARVVFGCSQCSQQIVKSYGSDWESPRMMFMRSCCCESIYYVKAVRIWNVLCSLKDKRGIFTKWFVESQNHLQCSLLCVCGFMSHLHCFCDWGFQHWVCPPSPPTLWSSYTAATECLTDSPLQGVTPVGG